MAAIIDYFDMFDRGRLVSRAPGSMNTATSFMQRFLAPSIAPVLALALLATLFSTNVYRAWTQSITYDEALSYLEFVAPAFSKIGQVYDANNHVLFTLLAKVSIWLLGLSEFSLRLPSLLGGLIYFAACFQLSRLLFGSGFLFLMSVMALALNPYLLDFLSAARGYGLALGLWFWAVYRIAWIILDCASSERQRARAMLVAGVCLALSVVANLTLAFSALALAGVFLIFSLFRQRAATKPILPLRPAQIVTDFLLPSIIIALLMLWWPLSNAQLSNFYYGAESLWDSLVSLRDASMVYQGMNLSWEDSPMWLDFLLPPLRSGVSVLAPALAIAMAAYFIKSSINGFTLSASHALTAHEKQIVLVAGTTTGTLLLLWIANEVFGVLYPMGRTGLYWIPLLTLAATLMLRELAKLSLPMVSLAALGGAFLVLCTARYVVQLKASSYADWHFNAGTKQFMEIIHQRTGDVGPSGRIRIGASAMDVLAIHFYENMFQRRDGMSLEGVDAEVEYDYYVLLPEDHGLVDGLQLKILRRNEISGAVLAIPTDSTPQILTGLGQSPDLEAEECAQLGSFVNVADAQADAHFLRDVDPGNQFETYRWTFKRPTLVFRLPKAKGWLFRMDFTINTWVLETTGPAVLTIRINGETLAQTHFDEPGEKSFVKAVPAEWLQDGECAVVEAYLDKHLVGRHHGNKLGYTLYAAGFVEGTPPANDAAAADVAPLRE